MFAIVGEGAAKAALQTDVRRLGLRNVEFLPTQPYETLSDSLGAADVHVVGLRRGLAGYIVPSKVYGILAAGRPYIAGVETGRRTRPHRRGARRAGSVVEPDDPEALAEGILRMRDSDLGEMGRNARKAFEERFDRPRATESYRQVLEDVFADSVALKGNGRSIRRVLQAFNELPDAVRYGLAFGIPCLVTLFATPFVARAAIRLGFVDHPAPHKTHVDPTPYLGGAAVAAGIGVTGVVAAGGSIQIATILVAAIAIACLGLVDDARGLQPPVKLAVEVAAAVALYVTGSGGGVFGMAVLDLPLTIVWVVVVTNALNLLDNMDGLAPGVAAMSAFAFFGISAYEHHYLVGSLAVALAGACLGFLPHNFPPARVFLGDAGSLLVGFLLAAIGLNLDLIGQAGVIRVAVPVLALAVPLFDTTLVVIARFRDGRPVMPGGTDHTSHRLAGQGPHARPGRAPRDRARRRPARSWRWDCSSPRTEPWSSGTIVATALAGGALLATLRLEHPRATSGEIGSDRPDRGPRGGRRPRVPVLRPSTAWVS